MKIKILNDNFAGHNCCAEHGLSYLVEADTMFLFDTGATDVAVKNAKVLGVDLTKIETIVLSHGHFDHAGGLHNFEGQELISHPGIFSGHYRKSDGLNVGIPLKESEAKSKFRIRYSKEPLWISEKVVFLGEIPRLNDFESKTTVFKDEQGNDDFVFDDTGVGILTEKGLIVLSGCAHAGICNMVSHAVKVTGEEKIEMVIGGFHLKRADKLTAKTIKYLKKMGVRKVMPSHCTSFEAMTEFYKVWTFNPLKSGDTIHF